MRDAPDHSEELREILPGVGSTIPRPRQVRLAAGDISTGYGTDPNLMTPTPTWPGALTIYERRFVSALSDVILPSEGDDPAPSEIGIDNFFDEWLSAPYQSQVADRRTILAGLDLLNEVSNALFNAEFMHLSRRRKRRAVDALVKEEGDGLDFFVRFRALVVGAYFTSDVGMRALGYRGNVPLRGPPGVSNAAKRIIDRELRKLGL